MVKLKGVMYTAKELISNIYDLEKLNRKACNGVLFERISTETQYTTEIQYTAEQNFYFFTTNAMATPVPIRTECVIKILLYSPYDTDQHLIKLNMDEVLIFLKGGRHIVLNKNDIEQEKSLEIE